MVPVTLKQVIDAFLNSPPSGSIFIDGIPAQHVAICANLVTVEEKPTFYTFTIDDGTGSKEVRMFRNTTEDESKDLDVQAGDYITFVASCKNFNNKWQINTSAVTKVTDFNEVIFHQLQALKAHVKLTSSPTQGKSESGSKGESGSELFVADNDGDAFLNAVKQLSAMCPDGVPAEQVASVVKMPVAKVTAQLDELVSEGTLYTPMDLHYLTMD